MSKNSPLLEEETRENIKQIKEIYLSIQKLLKKLSEYNEMNENELPFSILDYNKYKKNLNNYFNTINSLLKNIKSLDDTTEQLKIEINNLLKKVDEKQIKEKENEYKNLIEIIDLKMKKNVPFYNPNFDDDNNNNNQNNNNYITDIKLKEYMNNNMQIIQRAEGLKEIKNISETVAKISDDIKNTVYKQGEKFDEIENNIIDMSENIKKGKKEIKKTDEYTKKNNKKLLKLWIIIFILMLIIYYSFKKLFN
jgi:t-SNARE complex subunit (syntaxin)